MSRPEPSKPVADSKNVIALFVMLGIGFGGGLLTSSFLRERDLQKRLEFAVEQSRRECDARLELARNAAAGTPNDDSESASGAGRESEENGIRGASGKDMINQYIQQKGPVAPPPSNPAPPPSEARQTPPAGAPPPAERKDDEPGYPRVMDISARQDASTVQAAGTVKNMGAGPCRGATLEITARDARGLTVGSRSIGTNPPDIEPFGTASFVVAFPSETGAANFSAEASCH